MGDDPDPLKIYQHNLDVVSDAILADDMATVCRHIKVPHLCRMAQTEIVVESEEEYAQGMSEYGQGLRNQGVTNYIRLVKQARFLTDDYIIGWHMSYVLNGATTLIRPYRSRMVLHLEDGIWRVVQADHELAADRWPVIGQGVIPGSIPGDYDDMAADFRATSESADPIYQAYLDALDKANNTDDFKAWCDLSAYPLSVHIKNVDHVIYEPEENRPFFDMVRDMITRYTHGRLERIADRAHFIAADQIVGYLTGTFYDGDMPVVAPVSSRLIIQHLDGGWKMTSVTNAVANSTYPYKELEVTDGLVTICEIQERMRQ